MKKLRFLIISYCLFITSFCEIQILKYENSYIPIVNIQLNSTLGGGWSHDDCLLDGESQSNCDSLKAYYDSCVSAGNSENDCENQTMDESRSLGSASSSDSLESELSALGADELASSTFLSVFITLIAEIVSGTIRISYAKRSTSAWIHFIAAIAITVALIGIGVGFRIHLGNLVEKNKKYLKGDNFGDRMKSFLQDSSAAKLQATSSSNEDFVSVQSEILSDQKKVFEALKSEATAFNWTMKIGSAAMVTAMGFAIGEIIQCGASLGTGGGCVRNQREKPNIFYTLFEVYLLNQLMPTGLAEEEKDNSMWVTNILNALTTSLLGGFSNAASSKMIEEGAKHAADETAKEIAKKASEKAVNKTAPILRVISFALSAANFFYMSHLFSKVSDAHQERITAIDTLKSKLLETLQDSSPSSSEAQTGTLTNQLSGGQVSVAKPMDFAAGVCSSTTVDGSSPSASISNSGECNGSQKSSFSLPSAVVGGTPPLIDPAAGLSTSDVVKLAKDVSEGKGISKTIKESPVKNSAVRKQAFKNLLKKAKGLASEITGDPNAFDKLVAEEKKNRSASYKKMASSMPKSLFESLSKPLNKAGEEKEKPQQFAVPKQKIDTDFEMPTMPQDGFEEFATEDGVHSGELTAVNDDFSDLESNANDIVKNDGVSIFKVIETRYKKSAYPAFFKRKKKD